ncbi:MAG: NAD(+)/NADH kinase [Eubacteriales bacterium]|nr:NAD(+)/NADH kinase [Eubacteriales bacterium]
MRIGIFTNESRDPGFRITQQCVQVIAAGGGEALISSRELAAALACTSGDYADCDLLISLGGDGTFLAMTHLQGAEQIPMIGINLGSVGFLPIIEPENLDRDLTAILQGEYSIEERMRLQYSIHKKSGEVRDSGMALNDVVVHRGASRSILTLDLWINEDEVERVPGDGLIVATPTGSTAYTLSAGGPIVHPSEAALIVTAICPHTLHNRSYLANAGAVVKVALPENSKPVTLSADGREPLPLEPGQYIEVKQAGQALKMLRLGRDNFYDTLADKIQKRGISK